MAKNTYTLYYFITFSDGQVRFTWLKFDKNTPRRAARKFVRDSMRDENYDSIATETNPMLVTGLEFVRLNNSEMVTATVARLRDLGWNEQADYLAKKFSVN